MINKYEKIITVVCEYKNIEKGKVIDILKDKECKYILFLLLKKYGCLNLDKLKEDFYIDTSKKINYNYKKAREKFFINKKFRELYLEMDESLKKII